MGWFSVGKELEREANERSLADSLKKKEPSFQEKWPNIAAAIDNTWRIGRLANLPGHLKEWGGIESVFYSTQSLSFLFHGIQVRLLRVGDERILEIGPHGIGWTAKKTVSKFSNGREFIHCGAWSSWGVASSDRGNDRIDRFLALLAKKIELCMEKAQEIFDKELEEATIAANAFIDSLPEGE